mmetsp:Transcript_59160/g.190282  ORF Transcript_59160/g.190282 Transcript_59160/m.190282 type:complete len:224 (-) Transcript_59160:1788-2459(-)
MGSEYSQSLHEPMIEYGLLVEGSASSPRSPPPAGQKWMASRSSRFRWGRLSSVSTRPKVMAWHMVPPRLRPLMPTKELSSMFETFSELKQSGSSPDQMSMWTFSSLRCRLGTCTPYFWPWMTFRSWYMPSISRPMPAFVLQDARPRGASVSSPRSVPSSTWTSTASFMLWPSPQHSTWSMSVTARDACRMQSRTSAFSCGPQGAVRDAPWPHWFMPVDETKAS